VAVVERRLAGETGCLTRVGDKMRNVETPATGETACPTCIGDNMSNVETPEAGYQPALPNI
jgi:hypothetical protein